MCLTFCFKVSRWYISVQVEILERFIQLFDGNTRLKKEIFSLFTGTEKMIFTSLLNDVTSQTEAVQPNRFIMWNYS